MKKKCILAKIGWSCPVFFFSFLSRDVLEALLAQIPDFQKKKHQNGIKFYTLKAAWKKKFFSMGAAWSQRPIECKKIIYVLFLL